MPKSYLTKLYSSSHFDIYGTTDCSQYPNDCLLGSYQAQRVADNMEAVWTKLNTYSFAKLGSHYDVAVYDMVPGLGGWCCDDYLHIDAYQVQKSDSDYNLMIDTMTIPAHEFFHAMQTFGQPDGAWATEGQASWSEDALFTLPDTYSGNSFVEDMAAYLAAPNKTSSQKTPSGLDWADYGAGIWWKYVGERYGTVRTEPETGIDIVRDFWDQTPSTSGVDAMKAILTARGTTMTTAFRDFVVANYTKELDTTGLAGKYFYLDEKEGQAYPLVTVSTSDTIALSGSKTYSSQALAAWGAVYHRANPASTCPLLQVSFAGSPSGIQQAYAVLAVRSKKLISDSRYLGDKYSIALYNDPALTEVLGIAAGLEKGGTYNIKFDCISPSLNIISPLQSAPAAAGDPSNPRRVMVMVEVTGSGGTFVEGLPASAFSVKVDGQSATILSSYYVMKQYWMVIKLPSGLSASLHDLAVTVSGASDSESKSILLKADGNFDELIVVDRSGSMNEPTGYPKMTSAKNAARLYVDQLGDSDRIGVVSFGTTATADYHPAALSSAVRTAAKAAINGFSAGGWTTLGGGLKQALSEFTTYGSSANPDTIILMSDGEENTWPCWEYHAPDAGPPKDCSTGPYVADTVKSSGAKVHTVAFGPSADQKLMQKIASATGGTYRYVSAPATSSATMEGGPTWPGTSEATAPATWPILLSEAYEYYSGRSAGRERITQATRTQSAGQSYGLEVYIDDSVSLAMFTMVQETPKTSGCDGFKWTFKLRSPSGITYDPASTLPRSVTYRDDPNHGVFRVSNPETGYWVPQVSTSYAICSVNERIIEQATSSSAVMVSAETSLGPYLYLPVPLDERQTGMIMPILGSLMGSNGPVAATLTALISNPSNETVDSLTLYDDGQHSDGAAGDGIYGALYGKTSGAGSYQVKLLAERDRITRWAFGDFYLERDTDSDDDGMPDSWERRYGLDPRRNDSRDDPDQDGLTNGAEFRAGTNPQNDDSDGGGERDGSEVAWNQNPLDPLDDAISPPGSLIIEAGNGVNTLRFPTRRNYIDLLLEMSTSADFSNSRWATIEPTGVYRDTGLINGTKVYYRLAARTKPDQIFHTSSLGEYAAGTPNADTEAPTGVIRINDGASSTNSPQVRLNLDASRDTEMMKISNTGDFNEVAWETYRSERSWRLSTERGRAMVFVLLRDRAQNVSRVLVDSILVTLDSTTTTTTIGTGSSTTTTSTTSTTRAGTTTTTSIPSGTPFITSVTPASGPSGGGVLITIMGGKFTSGTGVRFAAQQASQVVVNSATMLSVITPPGSPGAVDVTVQTAGGTVTLTKGYTYLQGNVDARAPSTRYPALYNSSDPGSCYWIADVALAQGAASGPWGLQIDLTAGAKMLDGGLNFGGAIDADGTGNAFAGFSVWNPFDESQVVDVVLDAQAIATPGFQQRNLSLLVSVFHFPAGGSKIKVGDDLLTNPTATVGVVSLRASRILSPGFYTIEVRSTVGSPRGAFQLGATTHFVSRTGGGFQGGVVLGGYMMRNDNGQPISAFAGICISESQPVHFTTIRYTDSSGAHVAGPLVLKIKNKGVVAYDSCADLSCLTVSLDGIDANDDPGPPIGIRAASGWWP